MRIAYFDCPSGAAGDMILGALVDAGCPLDKLRSLLAQLDLVGYELTAREVKKGAFRATKVDVKIDRAKHPGHRSLPEILELLRRSALPEAVKSGASRIFTRLAEAEAKVHGTAPTDVRFHDVGAVDAIIDITGAVAALHLMGVEAVHISALPLGGGAAQGPHGKISVPAPGTAELLKGFPLIDNGVKAELVTPTGAAVLTTLAASAGAMPPMTVREVGYGAGDMELPIPNLLRCFIGETASRGGKETVAQIETTIDDMSPQLYEPLIDRLFEAGALDVFLTPVIMKRSRPGVVLTALCPPSKIHEISTVIFQESSTIGLRWTECERITLPRELITLPTTYGPITFKISRLEGEIVTIAPEFEEARRIAQAKGVPVREVLDRARIDGRRALESQRGLDTSPAVG